MISERILSKGNSFNELLVQVLDCFEIEGEAPVKFSSETLFVTDKYEIA